MTPGTVVQTAGAERTHREPRTAEPLSILQVMLTVSDQSFPYNELSLPLSERHDISILTFFSPEVTVPRHIDVHDGEGSIRTFLRCVDRLVRSADFDVAHVHSPHVALFLLLKRFRKKVRAPLVYTVHNSYDSYRFRNKLLMLPGFSTCDRVVCCSEASRSSFPGIYRRLAGERLRAIPNGVDLARIDAGDTCPRERSNGTDPSGELTVTSVGRLVPIKNPHHIVDAFARHVAGPARLLFVGDGPLRRELENRAARLPDGKRMEITGVVPREEVYGILKRSDLFVSASDGEGLPVSVLEAMACRTPVLLSDIPPHREIAGEADFIPLVRPGDASGLGRSLARLSRLPAPELGEIGNRCRELVARNFTLDKARSKYEGLYWEIR